MKFKHPLWALGLVASLFLSHGVMAQSVSTEDTQRLQHIQQRFEAGFDGVKVDEVRATPFANLFEVRIAQDVLYVDEQVEFVLQGSLIDVATRTDLTANRVEDLKRVDFSSLPLDQAIRYVKGDGKRTIAIFEDPNCIYCKRLHETLKAIDNITVYSFMFPILSPDSMIKAESIWCADDQAAAWQAWMTTATEPKPATCTNPIKESLALGMSLGVQGTPAIFFTDGSRVGGWLPADQLEEKLRSIQ